MMSKTLCSVVALAALMAGCGSAHEGGAHAPIPMNDTEFIDGMVPHHQGAVVMADMVLQRGAKAELKTMAQRMKDSQAQEITLMRAARQQLTGSAESPQDTDPHMVADEALMADQAGAALDRLFLAHMIPHHAGAIELAHRALPNLKRDDLRILATSIAASQAREIGDLQAMLSTY